MQREGKELLSTLETTRTELSSLLPYRERCTELASSGLAQDRALRSLKQPLLSKTQELVTVKESTVPRQQFSDLLDESRQLKCDVDLLVSRVKELESELSPARVVPKSVVDTMTTELLSRNRIIADKESRLADFKQQLDGALKENSRLKIDSVTRVEYEQLKDVVSGLERDVSGREKQLKYVNEKLEKVWICCCVGEFECSC